MVAASVAKKDQKKPKDRCSMNIFVEKQWDKETELITKLNGSVFWTCSFIILKLWKSNF